MRQPHSFHPSPHQPQQHHQPFLLSPLHPQPSIMQQPPFPGPMGPPQGHYGLMPPHMSNSRLNQGPSYPIFPAQPAPDFDAPPRPHPHLPCNTLFLSHVPSDIVEDDFFRIIRECLPFRIKLFAPVHATSRISPDAYYDWMPKEGRMDFDDKTNAERALAVLTSHPMITTRAILVSPYTDITVLPVADSRPRYVRPVNLTFPPRLAEATDPIDAFMAQCPTPAELFEAVRPWGSVRELRVWATDVTESPWAARVEFWYEDEARRFEVGFGQKGLTLKGWQVLIIPETGPDMGLPYPPNQLLDHAPFTPSPPYQLTQSGPLPAAFAPPPPGNNSIFPHMPSRLQYPPTPPHLNYSPPWADHNPFTVKGTDMPGGFMPHHLPLSPPVTATATNIPLPTSPIVDGSHHGRHRSNSSRTSMSNLRQSARQRTWSVTLEEGPDGEMRPTGFVADDGMAIHHGPGQHIRPAPVFGPGSSSQSGLVDYSNVFVKNLPSDVNSAFLAEHFAPVGRIVSARVMRDDLNRSRGYGFVSFHTPEEASNAIRIFDDTKLGENTITVTLHEPRKLRPEKIAERVTASPVSPGPSAFGRGRRSLSPLVTKRIRTQREPQAPAVTDQLRSLSPVSRKAALASRVSPIVARYAQLHLVPEDYCEPTVKALANHDLALIPLLHDKAALDAKIAETVSVLQGDPELDINFGIARPQRLHPPTKGELAKVRDEVAKIDPVDVDAVMPIMLQAMTGGDTQLCLDSRSVLAGRYNAAKRLLLAQRGSEQQEIAPEDIPLPQSDPPIAEFERMQISAATIEMLAALSASDIMANLAGGEGDALLGKLGVSRPTAKDKNLNEAWTKKTLPKSPVERKAEIANMLARKLDSTMKRSQKIKIAKEIVNAEPDDEALCALMAYPAILKAKMQAVAEEMDPKSSS